MSDTEPVIIFDNGSGYLKAGLSNQEAPEVVIPSVIGRPMFGYAQKKCDVELKPLMIGDEVPSDRRLLDLTFPIKNGKIEKDEDMELLWEYVLQKKLRLSKKDLKNRKILLTESFTNDNSNKKKIGEIIFEKIGLRYMNIEPQAKMVLFSSGNQTGTVIDCGENETNVIPIAEGYLLHHNIKGLDIGGKAITDNLIRLLQFRGYQLAMIDFENARQIKEKYCFVSCDIDLDRKLEYETTFYNSCVKLPDGREINISKERFEAPEILFQPELIQNEGMGLPEMFISSVEVIKFYLIFLILLILEMPN